MKLRLSQRFLAVSLLVLMTKIRIIPQYFFRIDCFFDDRLVA